MGDAHGPTRVDLRQLTNRTQYLTDEAIRSAERGVNPGAHTDQPTGHSERQQVVLRVQRHDAAEDGLALIPARTVLRHDPRADLDLLAEAEDTGEDGATSDAAFELVDFSTGLVDVEGTDNDEAGVGGEVADGNGDALYDVFVDGVDVVLQLRGDRDDGRVFGDSSCISG